MCHPKKTLMRRGQGVLRGDSSLPRVEPWESCARLVSFASKLHLKLGEQVRVNGKKHPAQAEAGLN
jgi:hypothetical protein